MYNVSLNCLKPKVSNSGHVYGVAKSEELILPRGVAVVTDSATLYFWFCHRDKLSLAPGHI
jgi:hypothetical protein